MEKPLTGYRFLQRLADLPFVRAIWPFGSRARGTAQARSDIDLAREVFSRLPANLTAMRAVLASLPQG